MPYVYIEFFNNFKNFYYTKKINLPKKFSNITEFVEDLDRTADKMTIESYEIPFGKEKFGSLITNEELYYLKEIRKKLSKIIKIEVYKISENGFFSRILEQEIEEEIPQVKKNTRKNHKPKKKRNKKFSDPATRETFYKKYGSPWKH